VNDLVKLDAAITTQAWPVVAAILIGLLVRLGKTDWMGNIFGQVPKRYRPLVPMVLGVISGIAQALLTVTNWKLAIFYGIVSGLLPIGGDQVISTTKVVEPPKQLGDEDVPSPRRMDDDNQ
jgi:hypothetical protein